MPTARSRRQLDTNLLDYRRLAGYLEGPLAKVDNVTGGAGPRTLAFVNRS